MQDNLHFFLNRKFSTAKLAICTKNAAKVCANYLLTTGRARALRPEFPLRSAYGKFSVESASLAYAPHMPETASVLQG